MAKGEWIAFLDSDDIWKEDKLEKQLNFMKKNNYNFSYSKYVEIDETSKCLGRIVGGPSKITKIGMYNYCWPGCLTVMYNANLVGLIQIANLKKNNDYAMWLQVIKECDCYLINEILAKYRRRQGSISNSNYWTLIKWHYKLYYEGDNKNFIISIFNTMRNLFFGMYKKLRYVKEDNV